jgi:DNA polymerase
MTAPHGMSADKRRADILASMGLETWRSRTGASVPQDDLAASEPTNISALRSQVSECRRCSLSQTRTQTVFGTGDPAANWMRVGEAPGADEDRQGEPFVGAAGKLLNEMLAAVGLSRDRVYIANILKCRPPSNRNPHADEIAACTPYLSAQIDFVRPRVILAVGRIAAHHLLGCDDTLGKMRGRVHQFGNAGTPLVVTYHPAYLLRSPDQKGKSWADLLLARSCIDTGNAT